MLHHVLQKNIWLEGLIHDMSILRFNRDYSLRLNCFAVEILDKVIQEKLNHSQRLSSNPHLHNLLRLVEFTLEY